MKTGKPAYICGPLTELAVEDQPRIKAFYSALGDACLEVMGIRAFVPHEHFDPVRHAHFTPEDIDRAERAQVCEETSVLIVAAIEPTWGGGIEVEMAHRSGVPALILCDERKLAERRVSRLLRGNPAVAGILAYDSFEDALAKLRLRLGALMAAHAQPV